MRIKAKTEQRTPKATKYFVPKRGNDADCPLTGKRLWIPNSCHAVFCGPEDHTEIEIHDWWINKHLRHNRALGERYARNVAIWRS